MRLARSLVLEQFVAEKERDKAGKLRRHRSSPWRTRLEIMRSLQHKSIHQILERLLPAALVRRDVPLGEHLFFERLEVVLARFDLGADAGGPGGVAVAEPAVKFTIGADGGGDLEAAGERVHPTDGGMEQANRLEALAAYLGVEVEAARGEAAVF